MRNPFEPMPSENENPDAHNEQPENIPEVNEPSESHEDKLRERIADIGNDESDPDIADLRKTLPRGQKRSFGRDGVDRNLPRGPESGSHVG